MTIKTAGLYLREESKCDECVPDATWALFAAQSPRLAESDHRWQQHSFNVINMPTLMRVGGSAPGACARLSRPRPVAFSTHSFCGNNERSRKFAQKMFAASAAAATGRGRRHCAVFAAVAVE